MRIKFFLTTLIIPTILFLSSGLIRQQHDLKDLKHELVEARHVKQGLFSVDEWKQKLTHIILNEIESFSLMPSQQKIIQSQLQQQLTILIDKVNHRLTLINSRTPEGRIKQTIMDGFIDLEEIK